MTERPGPSSFRAAFERTVRLSRFVERACAARPELERELEARGAAPFERAEMRAALAGADEDLGSRLRRLRERVMVALAHRDLNGLAGLDEVFATVSALAEECVAAACHAALRAADQQHGEPLDAGGGRRSFIVAALGKLGGAELNVSSDIDLVFVHDGDGETHGAKPVTHQEYFAAVGRRLIALVSEPTGEGIAFRVDMRLRPFGDSGPLVTSLAALEDYFIGHARPWERYAWLKSRVIAGPGAGLAALVEPFVYRRYLDYGLLAALRELHARIFEAAVQRRKADDIKVGAGGIREIEFAVQLFQMVRGGRDPALRTPSTRAALAALAERNLIDAARARALGAAYEFLRRLEHRLQYYDDQQTQALPRSGEPRELLAASMDFRDYGALLEALDGHRRAVAEAFGALFDRSEEEAPNAGAARVAAWLNDPQASPDPEGLAEDLAEAGLKEPKVVATRLIEYTRSRRYRAQSGPIRAKVDVLLPAIVSATAREGGESATAIRLLELIEAIDRREAYYSLLVEYPQVLARAARIAARSRWAARLLARHPILLDELTRTAASFTATDWAAERKDLARECAQHRDDLERVLEGLRHFKQRHVLRLAIADIEGELPVMALSDELSALADAILDVTLAEAAMSMGLEVDAQGAGAAGLAIIGYGKLGGKELGYGSDLDIIFLFDETRVRDFERLARVAQRVNTWLTSYTAAGVLYETDLRLRPDGAAGLLVSSFGSFRDYQAKRAWTWEHQALTRARFCSGDRELGARFERLRDELLAAPRDCARLYGEIVAMRRKMRSESKSDASDLKHVAGGLIDLEFCVQALVLCHGPKHPQLRENKGNHTLLKRCGALGLIDADLAAAAADAYLAMRHRVHQAALNDEDKVRVAGEELAPEREAVRRLWSALFGAT